MCAIKTQWIWIENRCCNRCDRAWTHIWDWAWNSYWVNRRKKKCCKSSFNAVLYMYVWMLPHFCKWNTNMCIRMTKMANCYNNQIRKKVNKNNLLQGKAISRSKNGWKAENLKIVTTICARASNNNLTSREEVEKNYDRTEQNRRKTCRTNLLKHIYNESEAHEIRHVWCCKNFCMRVYISIDIP